MLTQLMFDKNSGFCKSCLNRQLSAFEMKFKGGLLNNLNPPTYEKIRELVQQTQALGLDPAIGFNYMRRECAQLYLRVFVMSKQDGVITPQEEQYLAMLQRELYLRPEDYAGIQAEIQYIKTVHQIRNGNLPVVRASIILPSSEICHWESTATYSKVLKSSIKYTTGSLVVTNSKMRMISHEGGFEFPLNKIAHVSYAHPHGINLQLTRTHGNGFYAVPQGMLLTELMQVLLNKYNRQVVYEQEGSRAIPQQIKIEVWHRDGGKCVQCRAQDYLEYDHIIPFSRGGASSTNNIQLLCRRCNNAKSNHI